MLINQIHADMMLARQNSDTVTKNLLITLYSEASKVGKDKRNGPSTDEEVIATVKKFIANATETSRLLKERNQNDLTQQSEVEILNKYLPSQLDKNSLETILKEFLATNNLSGPRAIGQAMAYLKNTYSGQYDGKMASEIIKNL